MRMHENARTTANGAGVNSWETYSFPNNDSLDSLYQRGIRFDKKLPLYGQHCVACPQGYEIGGEA